MVFEFWGDSLCMRTRNGANARVDSTGAVGLVGVVDERSRRDLAVWCGRKVGKT